MKLSTLKRLRIIVPGILILIGFFLFIDFNQINYCFQYLLKEYWQVLYIVFSAILVPAFGSIYKVLNLRNILFKRIVLDIDENIKDKLISPFANDDELRFLFSPEIEYTSLKSIFYQFVDNDKTLKVKAELIYHNGLFLTSFLDFSIIGFFFSVFYFAYYFLNQNINLLIKSNILFIVILIINWFVIPKIVVDHKKLSNEQLEIITTSHHDELKNKLKQLKS